MSIPNPKTWLIENLGKIPDDEDKKNEWMKCLGLLFHYKCDIEEMNLVNDKYNHSLGAH